MNRRLPSLFNFIKERKRLNFDPTRARTAVVIVKELIAFSNEDARSSAGKRVRHLS